ncbi:WD40 repeat domain-containing protein [Fimbriiglobus ruber]|uniref:WD-40 repeat protein n=1 Tax=Fimbriiglobus ruber TaxID=1908690 RepID=A0A225DHW7_9BACT|nr:WD40 repeat domain-containing protein [Fimbriiglobus ruber]OWK41070.1 WD-40 repeat protein [Fimbriiglobus ruber]
MIHLTGHTKDVRAVAFAPDGRLASGSTDGTVRLWDPGRGECISTIRAGRPVYAVAVAADGRTLAYSGRPARTDVRDNLIELRDLSADQNLDPCVWEMPPNRAGIPTVRSIWSLSFSADGQHLAAASRQLGAGNHVNGGGARVWQLSPPYTNLPIAVPSAYTVAFSPRGAGLTVTGERGIWFFLDHVTAAKENAEAVTSSLPCDWAAAVAHLPDGATIVGANSFLLSFDPTGRTTWRKVKTGFRAVTSAAASPIAPFMVIGGSPNGVEIYDTGAGIRRTAYDFGIGKIHAVAFAPDGLTFAVAGDGGLMICDADVG